jgi:hypothetical protein
MKQEIRRGMEKETQVVERDLGTEWTLGGVIGT